MLTFAVLSAIVLGLGLLMRAELRRINSPCPKCGSHNVYHPYQGGCVCFDCHKEE